MHLNGDNMILKKIIWGGTIVGYRVKNHVPLRSRVAVKLNFRPYIRRYTPPPQIVLNTVTISPKCTNTVFC